jgi:hypothetical protein
VRNSAPVTSVECSRAMHISKNSVLLCTCVMAGRKGVAERNVRVKTCASATTISCFALTKLNLMRLRNQILTLLL